MKAVFALIIVAFAAFLIFGCTSNQPNSDANNPPVEKTMPAPHPTSNISQTSPANPPGNPPGQKTEPKNTTPEVKPAESPADQLANFFNLKGSKGWQADYTFTSITPGVGNASGKMKIFFKSEKMLRTDITMMGTEARTFVKDAGVFVCTNSGKSWSCQKSDMSADTDNVEKGFMADQSKYTVELAAPRTIAGTLAACMKSTGPEGVATYCFSPDGVPLYTKINAKSGGYSTDSEMVATSFKMSVSDSDFDLPAAVTTAPAFGGLPSGSSNLSGSSGGTPGDACSYCSMLSGDQKDACLKNC